MKQNKAQNQHSLEMRDRGVMHKLIYPDVGMYEHLYVQVAVSSSSVVAWRTALVWR